MTLTDNRANIGGGLSAVGSAEVTMKNCTITGNSATSNGGGIFLSHAVLNDTGSGVTENTCVGGSGGGIYAENASAMTLDSTLIAANRCLQNGGGIYAKQADVTLNLIGAPSIRNNHDQSGTGGVYLVEGAMIHVTGPLSAGSVAVYAADATGGADPRPFTIGLDGNGAMARFVSASAGCAIALNADGEAALCACTAQTLGTPDFTLSAAISVVEAEAFEGAAMTTVYIPDGCTSIGAYAFRDCKALKRIRIPAGCALGEDVFDGCGPVFVFAPAGSPAEAYCRNHNNCVFVEQAQE